MADEAVKALSITEIEARIADLATQVTRFKLGGLAAFSAGDCTNGCTGGCTDGCTGGCTGGCLADLGA